MLLYQMSKMESECMDYERDKRIIFKINIDDFRLISRKSAFDYTDDRLQFFVRLQTLILHSN
jgi:hypothetical protein